MEEREEAGRPLPQHAPVIVIQWHVTARCDQTCRHCYMYEPDSYRQEREHELSLADCQKILDDLTDTLERWGFRGQINFTGGDPLLREDFFELLEYVQRKAVIGQVGILGNPFHLTPRVAQKLKSLGVSHYQISLDGLQTTHDSLRSLGSFEASLEGIWVLQEVGLQSVVMFTLSRLNMGELLAVQRLCDSLGVERFSFDRMVPVGRGAELKGELLDNRELKELMIRYREERSQTHFANRHRYKSHLFQLLQEEYHLLKLPEERDHLYGGCAIGRSLSILADGRVLMCRRLPLEIGKFPEQSFAEVFIESPLLNRMRDLRNFHKCSRCPLGPICRGCPAVTYGVTGDPFAADSNCWRVC